MWNKPSSTGTCADAVYPPCEFVLEQPAAISAINANVKMKTLFRKVIAGT